MRTLILSILFSLISMPAFSQSCNGNGSVDLTRAPGSMAQITPLNQGGTGLCYAFTIAQLVDTYRYRTPQGRVGRIAPMPLGLMTPQASNFLTRSRLDDGGSVQAALATLNTPQNPVCDQGYIARLYGSSDDQFTVFATVELMYKRLREAYYAPCNCTPTQRQNNARSEVNSMKAWLTNNSLLNGEPAGGMQDFIGDVGNVVLHLNQLQSSAFANYNNSFNSALLDPLFNRVCEGHRLNVPRLRLTGVRNASYEFNTQLQAVNSTQMNNYAWNTLVQPNAQPVGITFCSKMLTTSSSFVSPAISGDNCGPHAAVLAGARCRNGRRQYLLRNTWGNNCGSNLAARHRPNCDGRGNVWVDADNLIQSTKSLFQTVP